jgi:hypothetical protein
MSNKYTYEQIAENFQLWSEYFDTDAAMTEAEFNSLSTDEKVKLQTEAFGEE